MNKSLVDRIGKSKKQFHKKRAEMGFEEKVKIIIQLQKINVEMIKGNKRKTNSLYRVWNIVT
jgi:hypothetical protein